MRLLSAKRPDRKDRAALNLVGGSRPKVADTEYQSVKTHPTVRNRFV
jgi:hypothetical protein